MFHLYHILGFIMISINLMYRVKVMNIWSSYVQKFQNILQNILGKNTYQIIQKSIKAELLCSVSVISKTVVTTEGLRQTNYLPHTSNKHIGTSPAAVYIVLGATDFLKLASQLNGPCIPNSNLGHRSTQTIFFSWKTQFTGPSNCSLSVPRMRDIQKIDCYQMH